MRGSVLAVDDANMLSCMACFAALLQCQGKYESSETMLREVILARSLSLGIESRECLIDRDNLCRTLILQGRYRECEIECRQVLGAQTRVLGPDRK